MKTVIATKYVPVGTVLQTVTRFIINHAPINHRLRDRIKRCPGCARRAKVLNNLVPLP